MGNRANPGHAAASFKTAELNYALCKYADAPDMWYSGRQDDMELAINICAQCFHKVECAALAIRGREVYGIWGGLTPSQRQNMRRLERRNKKGIN